MLQQTPCPLFKADYRRIPKSRRLWDSQRRKRKMSLTFDEVLAELQAGTSFEEIGAKGGVTKQAFQQVYDRYFSRLFDGKSGKERRLEHLHATRLVGVKRAEKKLFSSTPFKSFVASARANGCVVEAVPLLEDGFPTGEVHQSILRINGHLCRFHYLQRRWRPNGSGCWYVPTDVSLSALDNVRASIYCTAVSGLRREVYIFRSETLRILAPDGRNTFNLYLPSGKRIRKCRHKNGINYGDHRNAFHLLS